ncbi:MAG: TolC family protein [Burkholderiaceae bacterium]|nr:TolC family protein [Burkholderiaceae bacterium]
MSQKFRLLAVGAAALLLNGCATVNFDQALSDTRQATQSLVPNRLELRQTSAQQHAAVLRSAQLLEKPLTMTDAVELALANSPDLQTLLAQSWADMSTINQSGRIANPVLTFERNQSLDEVELGRLLSFGLLDLLTLPQRQNVARNRGAQANIQLSANVVDKVAQVRQAWVRAVAAEQTAQYAQQVNQAAQASAELAKRMLQTGNFNKLQRARQHAFYADAVAQLALARHGAIAAREELVRQLGLDDAQTARLKLPERLPDLPEQARTATELSATAMQQRLDVQQARLQLDGAGKAQGLSLLNTLADVEVGIRRDTITDTHSSQSSERKGYEVAIRLPLFDWGGTQRAAMNAQTLAAANHYESVLRSAAPQLRTSYSAYRTSYDLARHYRDEIVPLRKTMGEENVLRYNAMLIGVFELLADTRENITSVMAAINAQQQFWLADAGLSAALLGKPLAGGMPTLARNAAPSASGGGH